MSASIRSLRRQNKHRRRVTLELRVPNAWAQWLTGMTTAEREHLIATAIKKYIKDQAL
jgi:hypothetical protein